MSRKTIIDLCIGDGCIPKPQSFNSGCFLQMKHSSKQTDYLLYKKQILENIGFKCKIDSYVDNKGYGVLQVRTTQNQFIKNIRNDLYPNGIKEITEDVASVLDEKSFAILFQDDGAKELVKFHRSNGERYDVIPYINAFVLHTSGFSDCSNLLLIKRLQDYKIEARLVDRKKYKCILISKKESKELFKKLIQPHMHKSMMYKIDSPTSYIGRI